MFNGISMIFGGNFAQILPIVINGSRAQTVSVTIRASRFWDSLKVLFLKRNMRVVQSGNNQIFADWIKTIFYNETRYGRIPLPPYIRQVIKAPELIDRIFPQEIMDTAHINPEFFNGRAILAVHHEVVREINAIVIRRMPGEIRVRPAVDRIVYYGDGNDPDEDIRREMINMLNPKSLPPAELELKVDIPVILLRNFNTAMGFCNGSRMIVKTIRRDFLECTLLRGDHKGITHVINRCKLNSNISELPWVISRLQYPVSLSFAITVNKSQGQSLSTVKLYLERPCFVHGQFYVGLSQITDISQLTVGIPAQN